MLYASNSLIVTTSPFTLLFIDIFSLLALCSPLLSLLFLRLYSCFVLLSLLSIATASLDFLAAASLSVFLWLTSITYYVRRVLLL